jgi:type I restriction enzyme S subunit
MMEYLDFKDCFIDKTGGNKKIKKSDYKSSGILPIIDQGKKFIGGYSDNLSDKVKCDIPCIVFGDHSRNVKYLDQNFGIGADGVKVLVPTEKVVAKYGFYILKNVELPLTGYDRSFKYLKREKFPIPDLPTQNKIVALLDKASALVQKREKSIASLDELLRAQFLDMFGDPVLNPKGWEMNKLSKICTLERGRFSPRPRNDPSYFNGDYPFIQTGDISNSNFRLSEFTQTLNSKGIKVSKEFKIGTIVIAIVGATIGKTAILEIDTYATDSIIGITPKNKLCNNYFIELVLRFYKESLIDKAPSAARANINLKILNKLDIISPSISLQNEFETFNHRIESQKETLSQSKTELEKLYNSLLQRAFKGQLNFNVDAELDVLLAAIDIDKKENDIRDIATVYASRLLERLDTQEFESQTQYRQAKHVAFQMLKGGIVVQAYDEKIEAVKMKLV